MLVRELAEKMGWKLLCGAGGTEAQAQGCYVGDLLSWVMGRAQENEIWLTVMGNVNAVAVATLAGVSAIVLTEGATLDDNAKARAEQQDIPIYATTVNTWHTATALYEAYKNATV